jgi:TRAP-type C4-dicarboxylate transport system permease small subunit
MVRPSSTPSTRSKALRRFLDRLYYASGALGAVFVLLICVLMIAQSVLREFGVRTGAVNDVVAWCCAAASFFAMAHAFKHGDFVRVTLLMEHLPEKARHRLEIVVLSIGTVSVAYLAYWANKFTYESFTFNEVAQGLLPIPIWIPQASFAFGSLLLLVAVVDELVLVLRGNKPSYVTAVEERHAKGDFSSDV